jgi:hypothetical protein
MASKRRVHLPIIIGYFFYALLEGILASVLLTQPHAYALHKNSPAFTWLFTVKHAVFWAACFLTTLYVSAAERAFNWARPFSVK